MGGDKMSTSSKSSRYPRYVKAPKGKQIHDIYKERIGQLTDDGQYRDQGLVSKINEASVSGDPHIKLEVYSPPDIARPTFADATSQEFKSTELGQTFGPSWSTHWFKVHLTVPKELTDKEHLELHWDADCEALVWTHDGVPLQGLTGYGERTEWILPKRFRDGETHVIYIEMACNDMFGQDRGGIMPPDPDKYYTLHTAEIVAIDLEARALFYDYWLIGDAAREFSDESWEQHTALQVCNDITNTFIAGNGSHETIVDCRKIAKRYLSDDVDSAKVYDSNNEALVTAVGNCHIDTCWLWPWAETKRKIVRSWMTQCDLLDRYPEHRFCASQGQQFKWLETLYPAAFDRVKEKVKAGTFAPIGGSWVEHDTNMPSGESLVRQFLYGQRYFESRFGQRCVTFWLPDTFGYSSQLPQLCRLAGMSRFFTQKISWNAVNTFEHTTFNWVALDGSQVLCHMTPAETYTAEADFGDLHRSITQHKSLDQDNTSLLAFGKGDGGGGPTVAHIEKLRRERAMSDKIGLLPRVKMGSSVDDFFDQLQQKAENGTDFVNWYGELYLELHRGTYTTQGKMKRNNRAAERLLHDIEYLATLASIKHDATVDSDGSYRYPKKDLDTMWEKVLLCQFHDCLPGSCIEMCYDDSDELYEHVFETGARLLDEALRVLGFGKPGHKKQSVALNTLGWERPEIVRPSSGDDESIPYTCEDQGGIQTLKQLTLDQKSQASVRHTGDNCFAMTNKRWEVKIERGAIVSLYDKSLERQIIPEGRRANQLVIFDDKPLYWQAWDVEVYHLESRSELLPSEDCEITEDSHDRVSICSHYRISEQSSIKVTTTLHAQAEESSDVPIEVHAEVDWHESHKFLKVEFPVDIHSTEATYETQFGLIKRPTHYNTSWDMAKFEVCCHKFADLSEHTYGVSILNDSKYGFAVAGNTMRLSLLRAPKAPDEHADMGTHIIRWGILPHSHALNHSTVRRAFEFNNPMRILSHDEPESVAALMSSFRLKNSDKGLVVDTIKRGEDDQENIEHESAERRLRNNGRRNVVLRVYDSLGGRAKGEIFWDEKAVKVQQVWKCNLLEDDLEELDIGHGRDNMRIELRAFEVASYRFLLA